MARPFTEKMYTGEFFDARESGCHTYGIIHNMRRFFPYHVVSLTLNFLWIMEKEYAIILKAFFEQFVFIAFPDRCGRQ